MPETDERERMRLWVETWKRTGEELDRIKTEELRALTEETAARWSLDLLRGVDLWLNENPGYEREECGLVEQQRLFAKWRPTLAAS